MGGSTEIVTGPLMIVSTIFGYKSISNVLNRTAFPKVYDNSDYLKLHNLKPIEPKYRARLALTHGVVVVPLILLGIYMANYNKKGMINIENNVTVNNTVSEKFSILGLFSRITMS
jgi:hypothetical protein